MSTGAIGYEVRGPASGIPILLIPPLGGSMALWGTFRTLLEQQFRVIAFDLRGTGRSARTREWATTRRLAGDALRVLDELGVDEAHVFGLSLGGMIATWLGILAPARVRKLCIASAPARGLDLRRNVGRHLAAVLREQPASRSALFELALASALHDTEGKLHRIRAHTLVLAGQNDKPATHCSRVLARAIPRATFEIIPGCGHDLTLEQPHVTAERVSRFLLS